MKYVKYTKERMFTVSPCKARYSMFEGVLGLVKVVLACTVGMPNYTHDGSVAALVPSVHIEP